MRLKCELYPEEQKNIRIALLQILDLQDNSILLADLDKDVEKQQKIMDLLPKIRTYFSLSHVSALTYPQDYKRPYLSVIKHILKPEYEMLSVDYRKTLEDGTKFRTKRYYFHKCC